MTEDLKEMEEQLTTPLDDYWEYIPQHRVLRRVYQTERVSGFVPSLQRGCPVPPNKLKSARRTVMEISGGGTYVQKGNWRFQKHQVAEGPPMWWRGYTDFYVQGKDDELLYLVKKGSDEVREDEITPEDWEKWRVADGEEWSKVSATDAVKELSVEESREIRRQLEEANLLARTSRQTVEACGSAWTASIDEIKVVHTRRSRSRSVTAGSTCSHSHYQQHCHRNATGSIQEVEDGCWGLEECVHAVRAIEES